MYTLTAWRAWRARRALRRAAVDAALARLDLEGATSDRVRLDSLGGVGR
jgi:hypothetical protein